MSQINIQIVPQNLLNSMPLNYKIMKFNKIISAKLKEKYNILFILIKYKLSP